MSLTKNATVVHNTFVIERSYRAAPERVFAALADPAKKRRWYAEGENHHVEEFATDFRVGGSERARFVLTTGPLKGTALTAEGAYQDIVPNQRVVSACTMSLGNKRISASLATFELLPNGKGTDLIFTHQAAFFEGADGAEMRENGWHKLLDRFAQEFTS
jgi:uncharacterized protein YndB with AHSA1/START domain